MRAIVPFGALLFWIAFATAAAADNTDQRAFRALNAAAANVNFQNAAWTPVENRQASELVASIRTSQIEMQRRFQKTPTVSASYAQTISADASALNTAASSDPSKSIALLKLVNADLSAKLSQANAGLGATDSLGDDVDVTVVTTKGGTTVSGYLIRANCATEADASGARFSFTNPSSPTTLTMPAGIYVIWAEQGGARLGQREVTVGDGRSPSQRIELNL